MDKIFVTLVDVFLIFFVYWFFLMKKEKRVEAQDSVTIIVEGGYSPNTIVLQKGKTTTVSFLRKDSNSCLEEIVVGDFHIRKYLPLHKKISINLTPEVVGEFPFSCGMNMYHGKIIVK